MLFGCWIAAAALLLPAAVTESGDGEPDAEPRISCTSDIMYAGSSLTCKLVGGRSDDEDDEDYEADGIKNMTVCSQDKDCSKTVVYKDCLKTVGGAISSEKLRPSSPDLCVTVHLKGGGTVTTRVNLNTIIKLSSPHVENVTFEDSNLAEILIKTPYHNIQHSEYLRENQQFQIQLHHFTKGSTTTLNFSSVTLRLSMDRLSKNAKYQVRVRALPLLEKVFKGTWSDWSKPFNFSTPAGGDLRLEKIKDTEEVPVVLMVLIVCFVSLVVVLSSAVLFWKNKIFTYMWPSIPHPKHTLVQICKPNRGLLLNFKPEVISALQVETGEEQVCEEAESSMATAGSPPPCSTQSSDSSRSTTSASTEELELSALLSRGSSDGEDSLQSVSPSPVQDLERPPTPQPEHGSAANEAEAYVTMSSFYQIK